MKDRSTKLRRTTRKVRTAKASTTDILGSKPPEKKPPKKWARHYRRLVALSDYLLRERGTLMANAREEVPAMGMHTADGGTDSYDRDFALSLLSSEQDALNEIDQALERIRDGTYGVCELTGKRIASKRLEAIPWARFSAEAEQRLGKLPRLEAAPESPHEES